MLAKFLNLMKLSFSALTPRWQTTASRTISTSRQPVVKREKRILGLTAQGSGGHGTPR